MNKLYFTLICFYLLSCTYNTKKAIEATKSDSELEVLSVNVKDIIYNKKLSDLIIIDSLVFLEHIGESLIGEINKVIVSDERIYVLDEAVSKGVFCFDRKGHYINSYKELGRGPHEYNSIWDIYFYNNKLYLAVSPFRIHILDKNLYFLNSIEIDDLKNISLLYPSLTVINEDTIIIADSELPYKFNFYSAKQKQFISYQSPTQGQGIEITYPPITKGPGCQFFVSETYKDTIYLIEQNKLVPKYFIDFEKPMSKNEKLREINRSPYEISPLKYLDKMYRISSFIENEEYISFTFIYYERYNFYFFNKEDSKTIIFPNNIINDITGGPFLQLTLGSHKTSLITYIEPYQLIKNKEQTNLILPENFSENANPVLIFYRPRF